MSKRLNQTGSNFLHDATPQKECIQFENSLWFVNVDIDNFFKCTNFNLVIGEQSKMTTFRATAFIAKIVERKDNNR